MQWNREDILKLIDCYREKPEIWNPTNADHMASAKRAKAWQDIASQFPCGVEEVKKRMASLLSSFRREKTKSKHVVGAGKGRKEIYESKWYAFKNFSFLLDRNMDKPKPKDSKKNEDKLRCALTKILDSKELNNEGLEEDDEGLEDKYDFNETENGLKTGVDRAHLINDRPETVARMNPNESESSETDSLGDGHASAQLPRKRERFLSPKNAAKKRKPAETKDLMLSDAFEMLKNATFRYLKRAETVSDHHDECSAFTDHIKSKLEKFGDPERTILMHKINKIIFEAEMRTYGYHNDFQSQFERNVPNLSSFDGTRQTQNVPKKIRINLKHPEDTDIVWKMKTVDNASNIYLEDCSPIDFEYA